ncbi:MAG: LacI family DNA-binding transcriptional regulator [Ferruginibacter sp.]
MQKSTLKKLSQTLGLSISTISRALKDHPDISEATKTKVKDLAAAMEYEPNSYAVQLRTRQSNVLGILVPTIDNFFYDSFIAAVEEEARKYGYSVLIMQSRDNATIESANLHIFRKNMVMGLFAALSVATEDLAPFRKLEELEVPVIFVDRVPEEKNFYSTCLADKEASVLAAEAIIAKKKKNVLALFGHPHLSITKNRKDAFVNYFKKKAPKIKLQVDFTENVGPSKEAAIAALTSTQPPDVIFCMGDLILIGVMKAIHELNLKVPDDVAVIGISNGFIPTMFNPAVTYVETSGSKLGKLAFAQMLGRLRKENVSEIVCVESVLVKGGSL